MDMKSEEKVMPVSLLSESVLILEGERAPPCLEMGNTSDVIIEKFGFPVDQGLPSAGVRKVHG